MPSTSTSERAFAAAPRRATRKWSLRILAIAVCAGAVVVGCDRWEGVSVRNDTDERLTLRINAVKANEQERPNEWFQTVELEPGARRDVGKIGGPPDPAPDITVRAYDRNGTLVYCRRFTPKQFFIGTTTPVSLTKGDIRC